MSGGVASRGARGQRSDQKQIKERSFLTEGVPSDKMKTKERCLALMVAVGRLARGQSTTSSSHRARRSLSGGTNGFDRGMETENKRDPKGSILTPPILSYWCYPANFDRPWLPPATKGWVWHRITELNRFQNRRTLQSGPPMATRIH
jgi:hypothetical protein